MAFLRPGVLFVVFASLVASSVAQQPVDNQSIFTITVAAPTQAKDVQVRYYFTGESSGYGESAASPTEGNKIVIKTGPEGKLVSTLKLVAYAPGCQLVTISVGDLASTNRQGAFQCTPLNTVQFVGHAATSAFAGKALQTQVLYECNWCPQFFGLKSGAISPFSVARADIDREGSFTINLPDFAADPLWSSVSNDASLFFYLVDGANGQPLGALKPSVEGLPKDGAVKVAPSYPQLDFTVPSN
jgi:hypothetical protein